MLEGIALSMVIFLTLKGKRDEDNRKKEIQEVEAVKKRKDQAQQDKTDFEFKVKEVKEDAKELIKPQDLTPTLTDQINSSITTEEDIKPVQTNTSIENQESVTDVDITTPNVTEETKIDELEGI